MVTNLKETGTPFAYKKVDFGKKVRKVIAPHNRAEDGLLDGKEGSGVDGLEDELEPGIGAGKGNLGDTGDKSEPAINSGISGFPDSRNRYIEKTFEDSD
jgi:hypothetical protein